MNTETKIAQTSQEAFQIGYQQGFRGMRVNKKAIPAQFTAEYVNGRRAGQNAPGATPKKMGA